MEGIWLLLGINLALCLVIAAVAASSGRSFVVVLLLCLVLTPLLGAICALLLKPKKKEAPRAYVPSPRAAVDPVEAWADEEEDAEEGRKRLPPL